MSVEIWKSIPNYEGLYEISNYGNVKTLARIYYSGKFHHNPKRVEEHLRKFTLNSNGYYTVQLMKDGKTKGYSVHTLVWDNFDGTPRISPLQIDHKDENKLNNHIDNLQLLTAKMNRRKSIHRDLPIGVIHYHNNPNRFQAQITKNGKGYFLGAFDTPEEAHQAYLEAEATL